MGNSPAKDANDAPLHYGALESEAWASGYNVGWDAAKADLPDRETVREVLYATLSSTNYSLAWPWTERMADAVLALFRGEEPK